MKLRASLFWTAVSALLLLAAARARAQQVYDDLSAQPEGVIRFRSVTPSSRYNLAHRRYASTVVWGTLSLPRHGRAPYPALVIAHGSAGVQEKDAQRWVPLLNHMGIATFAVDSFKPRSISRSDDDQSVLDQSANDADALSALKLLASDPRIDASRIGVMGFSRGGIVALETAIEPFRQGVIDNGLRFAAHIAFYPGCGLRYWRTPSPLTGAPIMMALAENDDYVPPRACIAYADAMKQAGQDVELHVYAGAYHDFDNTVSYLQRGAMVQTSRRCADREVDPVNWKYKLLASGETFSDYPAFAAKLGSCAVRDRVTIGSNAGAAREAERDVQAFLRRVFKL